MKFVEKQRVVSLLRHLRILPLAEQGRYLWEVMRKRRSNEAIVRANPEKPFPPYRLLYETTSGVDYPLFYEVGRQLADHIHKLASSHVEGKLSSICEWGCGLGRVIMHMPQLSRPEELQAFGTDYNESAIAWAKAHLPEVDFRPNQLEPPLPFEENHFDCLYSTSVYTHLSEKAHYDWLKENLRVVRPGGVVIMTTHGDAFAEKLLPKERAQYDAGQLVVRGSMKEGSRLFCAFHSPRFMRDVFLRDLKVLLHEPSPDFAVMGGQDVWVVSKQ